MREIVLCWKVASFLPVSHRFSYISSVVCMSVGQIYEACKNGRRMGPRKHILDWDPRSTNGKYLFQKAFTRHPLYTGRIQFSHPPDETSSTQQSRRAAAMRTVATIGVSSCLARLLFWDPSRFFTMETRNWLFSLVPIGVRRDTINEYTVPQIYISKRQIGISRNLVSKYESPNNVRGWSRISALTLWQVEVPRLQI